MLTKYFKVLQNNVFLLVIGVVLLLLTFTSLIYGIFLLLYLIYAYVNYSKEIFYTLISLLIILIILFLIYNGIYKINQYSGSYKTVIGVVSDVTAKDSYYKITIKTNQIFSKKIILYTNSAFDIGDIIKASGTVKNVNGVTIPNGFDYLKYLEHKKYYFVMSCDDVEYLKRGISVTIIKYWVNNYMNYFFDGNTLLILKGLLLGDSSGFSESFHDELVINGITHLFAVSGLHISFFVIFITKILTKLKLKDKHIENVLLVLLALYIIIASFAPSIIRASLMYALAVFNKRKLNKFFSSLDIISITFLSLILINVYYLYDLGFVLSFLVAFSIMLVNILLKNKSNTMQILVISIVANIVTLPVIVNINNSINLLVPLLNVLYITMVSVFLLPLSFITVLLPICKYIYEYVITGFMFLINLSSNFNISLSFPDFQPISVIIYYGLIVFIVRFFYNKKIRTYVILILLTFLLVFSNIGTYKMNAQMDFLYLSEGDSTIIQYKNDVIIIDTGTGENSCLSDFLRSRGIKKIDCLILTHNHHDHNGEAGELIDNFKIDKIVVSKYDNSIYSELDGVSKVSTGDKFSINSIYIEILHPDSLYPEMNDNSIVLYMIIDHVKFLFTGDATSNVESKLTKYDVDILKVGHHGSITSTSEEFITAIKPEYAIIMTGESEMFPSPVVTQRLKDKNVQVFSTNELYSIKLIIKNSNLYFSYLNN
ncbi:MAG: DNA internalization-related competence protein ComEC/Rec2 [Bacilli bacterium]